MTAVDLIPSISVNILGEFFNEVTFAGENPIAVVERNISGLLNAMRITSAFLPPAQELWACYLFY